MNPDTLRAWKDAAEIARDWRGDDCATVDLLRMVWRWQGEAYSDYQRTLADALASAWGNPAKPERKHR